MSAANAANASAFACGEAHGEDVRGCRSVGTVDAVLQVAKLSSALCIAREPGCKRLSSAHFLCALLTHCRRARFTAVPNARLALRNRSRATPGALCA